MTQVSEQRLVALMFTDLVGSVALQGRLGTEKYTRLIARHDEIFKKCLSHFDDAEILNETGDGFLVKFATPTQAVSTALRLQAALHDEVSEGEKIEVRIGVHMGSITEMDEAVRGEKRAVGMAINLAARIMDLAEGGQILMTRAVFDEARQFVREHPDQENLPASAVLQWPAHGRYIFKGNDEPLEIYEVGAEGMALLSPPEGSEKAKRAVAADEEDTLGWRPGAGIAIPRMEEWVVDRQIGAGGFGEVWLARNQATKEERVFKFCFDPERLRSFRRELTLFRLLRDALGKREDIAALHDVSVEMPPFYLESEFVPGGNLAQWADSQGGIETVSMATRLDLVARTARAVEAAHSVGIVHKDIKPSNVLIAMSDGEPRPRLADFGIGAVTDESALSDFGITQAGFTQSIVYDSDSGTNSMSQLYAPPEYLVGGQAHPKGDIFSLGVMLYQLASGDLKRPLASGWQRDIPDQLLCELIENCVDVDPERRFERAAQLADGLETLEERREQIASEERLRELGTKAKKRFRILVGGALLCGGLVALSAVLATSYFKQRDLTEEAQQLRLEARQLASQSDFLLAGQHMDQDRRAIGIAYLARSLRSDPSNRAAAQKLFSTLAYSWFPKPKYAPLQTYEGTIPERYFFGDFDANYERFIGLNEEKQLTIFDLASGEAVRKPFDNSGQNVRDVAWIDGDSKVLAVVFEEGLHPNLARSQLKMWDVETGAMIRQEPQGEGNLRSVSLAADGSYWIAVDIAEDGTDFGMQFWDLRDSSDWKKIALPRPSANLIETARYSEETQRIVGLMFDVGAPSKILVLDLAGIGPDQWIDAQWREAGTAPPWERQNFRPPSSVSEDGRRIAVPTESGSVMVFDLDDGESSFEIEKPNGAAWSLRFSPSGERLAIGYFDGSAVVWDVTNQRKLPATAQHEGGITGIAISPDGSTLLTGSVDGTGRLSNIDSGQPIGEPLGGHRGWVAGPQFSEDGTTFTTFSMKGTIAVWERASKTVRATPLTPYSEGAQLWSVSQDGEWAVANRGTEVVIRRAGEDEEQVLFEAGSKVKMVGAGKDDVVFVLREPFYLDRYDLKTGAKETHVSEKVGALLLGNSSDDGHVIITGTRSSLGGGSNNSKRLGRESLGVWRLDSKKIVPQLLTHNQRVTLGSISGDGRRAVSSSVLQTLLWNLEEADPQPRSLEIGLLFAHSLNRDGTRLLTGTAEGQVRLWDFDTTEPLSRNLEHPGQVVAVGMSEDGSLGACLGFVQRGKKQIASVKVWDLASEETVLEEVTLPNVRLLETETLEMEQDSRPQIEFSRDKTYLLAVWDDVVSKVDLSPSIDETIPEWVPAFAEQMGGKRLEDGKLNDWQPDQPVVIDTSGSRMSDWANWLVESPSPDQPLSPVSRWKRSDYADYLANPRSGNLDELLEFAPTDPRPLASLAKSLVDQHPGRATQLGKMSELRLETGDVGDTIKARVFRDLALLNLSLGTRETLAHAVSLAGRAVESDPDDLQSRVTAANALNQLAAISDHPDGGPSASVAVAALWIEILSRLGMKTDPTSLDRGFSSGADWRYDDGGIFPGEDWFSLEFDDSEWKSGPGPFGFGDDREATAIEPGGAESRRTTSYFRRTFEIVNPSDFAQGTFDYQRDDGIVIYLNGSEVRRDNMPDGDIAFETLAARPIGERSENLWHSKPVPLSELREGTNLIAIELHQSSRSSTDLHLDFRLLSNPTIGADLLRGDSAAVESLLEKLPELSAAQKDELRSVFDSDSENPVPFVTLARSVRLHLQDDPDAANAELDKLPPTEDEPSAGTIAAAKTHLLEKLGEPEDE